MMGQPSFNTVYPSKSTISKYVISKLEPILNSCIFCIQINILAARTVASLLKTSLGPKGMDKMLVSPDGEVIITNDGATILEKMEVSLTIHKYFYKFIHFLAHSLVQKSQQVSRTDNSYLPWKTN